VQGRFSAKWDFVCVGFAGIILGLIGEDLRMRLLFRGTLRSITCAVFVMVLAGLSAFAQKFSVVYKFDVTHGQTPQAGLVRDSSGNLYGTTASGGSASSGVVFKINPQGRITVLHTFNVSDGAFPRSDLTLNNKTLYGTTLSGGASDAGTVFKIATSGGGFKTLYSFTGGNDGSNPGSGVIRDAQGNLYGTTEDGGEFLSGTLYRLGQGGKLTVLHSFTGGSDGAMPMAEPILDGQGNLYGTTEFGGDANGNCVGLQAGCGVVYKVGPKHKLTVLHSFTNLNNDGAYPLGALLLDASGNLYGTTSGGGGPNNFGIVFKIGSKGKFARLHSFDRGIPDGEGPQGALVRDSAGHLYGTTTYGGNSSNSGTVFEITSNGKEKVLHSFGAHDGTGPQGALLLDPNNVLYGLTVSGGPSDAGVVFKIAP
jgi:uncharacterized repeat protein (TIGR03803 family)